MRRETTQKEKRKKIDAKEKNCKGKDRKPNMQALKAIDHLLNNFNVNRMFTIR